MVGLNECKTKEEKRALVHSDRIEEIERINDLTLLDEPTESEDYREPLSMDREEVVNIMLSWGGGADGFKLWFKDKELMRGIYWMSDWGEYEESDLTEEESQTVFDFYMGGCFE